ncbi:unnamed protein product [Rotaria sordida]|uniref:F-box domain-containing protein n=1 Tax=Rotaria sordida TaxID=392033 RepID=A0A814XA21_9BILA|nr:unnamed protein product [Rotaria sordida]
MEYSSIQLNDLPDEILMIVFKKLDNVALLYSLIDVNMRLNNIVKNSIFTNCLTLLRFVPSHLIVLRSLSTYFIYPLDNSTVDRFCLHILPKINEKIQWFDLESLSMERILLVTNYPNLCGLDETLFSCTLKNQILSLVIDINTNGMENYKQGRNAIIFSHIFSMFSNLRYLNFCPPSIGHQRLSFDTSPLTVISKNLLELHVSLRSFTDCLYLLDGRFNKLHTLYVNISLIRSLPLIINNREKLFNLKYFSLHCAWETFDYDELIVPLLHRMSNLEKLDLNLIVCERKTFIDGNELKINIVDYMPELKNLTFNIRSTSSFYNKINFPSNEDIQNTFTDFKDKKIMYCTDYFPKAKYGQCHIYSYPYKQKHYDGITNNFPDEIFKYVRKVSLFDERPFEHEFFLRISQSFPLMEILIVVNEKRQNNKQFRKSKNENQDLSIIEYPRLIQLDLFKAHKDYYEQFLYDTKTSLLNDLSLYTTYPIMQKVTRNFRRNATRTNCSKITYLYFYIKSTYSEHLKEYFPHAKIV